MLILTRREEESILIGDGIEVQLVAVNGQQVRIGIKAPKDVKIVRKELTDGVQET